MISYFSRLNKTEKLLSIVLLCLVILTFLIRSNSFQVINLSDAIFSIASRISLNPTVFAQDSQHITEAAVNVIYETKEFKEDEASRTFKYQLIDRRAIALDKFFESKNSPLAGQGATFIKYCDSFGAPSDCTTIPAISLIETNYCKYYVSAETHNCWGFGGAGANRMKFASFDEAIKLITNRLANQYGNDFLSDPSIAAKTYCGPQCNGAAWAATVDRARREMDSFAKSHGYGSLFSN